MTNVDGKATFTWLGTIRKADLSGLLAMIATHCEPRSYDQGGNVLVLEAHLSLRNYIESGAGEKLRSMLASVLGDGLVVMWEFGAAANSPAIKAKGKKVRRETELLYAIQEDKFANYVIEQMGAKIILDSIVYVES